MRSHTTITSNKVVYTTSRLASLSSRTVFSTTHNNTSSIKRAVLNIWIKHRHLRLRQRRRISSHLVRGEASFNETNLRVCIIWGIILVSTSRSSAVITSKSSTHSISKHVLNTHGNYVLDTIRSWTGHPTKKQAVLSAWAHWKWLREQCLSKNETSRLSKSQNRSTSRTSTVVKKNKRSRKQSRSHLLHLNHKIVCRHLFVT